MSSLKGQNVLITGASMGIGLEIAKAVAAKGANLTLFSRTESKLKDISHEIQHQYAGVRVAYEAVDIQSYEAVNEAVKRVVSGGTNIDVLINNAGLALGTPATFPNLKIEDITQMTGTNINGLLYTTYAVLNHSLMPKKRGTILNISSTTALEPPPFPGEAIYHASKQFQEGFSNSLRNELVGTDIRVLVLRPGVVDTNFHRQRVGLDDRMNEEFMKGFTPLQAAEVAQAAVYMLEQPEHISVKALDVVPSAQRSLPVFDREWNGRNGKKD